MQASGPKSLKAVDAEVMEDHMEEVEDAVVEVDDCVWNMNPGELPWYSGETAPPSLPSWSPYTPRRDWGEARC